MGSGHCLLVESILVVVGVQVADGIVVVVVGVVVEVGVLVVVGIAVQGIDALHLVFLALCRCCCHVYNRTTMALCQEDRCDTWTDRCMQVYGFSTLKHGEIRKINA